MSRSYDVSVSMISKIYVALDENEKFGVFGFGAKYVIKSKGICRDRVVEMMDYYQVKFST